MDRYLVIEFVGGPCDGEHTQVQDGSESAAAPWLVRKYPNTEGRWAVYQYRRDAKHGNVSTRIFEYHEDCSGEYVADLLRSVKDPPESSS